MGRGFLFAYPFMSFLGAWLEVCVAGGAAMAKPSGAAAVLIWLSGYYKSIVFLLIKCLGCILSGGEKLLPLPRKLRVFYY